MNRKEFEAERRRIEQMVENAKHRLLTELREKPVDYEKVGIADEALRDAIERLMTLTAARADESV